jgi:hypothetical protein
MANKKQPGGDVGYKKAYKMTGTPGYAGGPGETTLDKGPSGSSRNNNWKIGASQAKMAKNEKVGPGKNLKDLDGGNFY